MGKKKRSKPNGFLRTFDKIDRLALRLSPHLLSNSGVAGMGYNAMQDGISIAQRSQRFGANEILLHTGYDVIAGKWNGTPLFVNIGARVDLAKMGSRLLNGIR